MNKEKFRAFDRVLLYVVALSLAVTLLFGSGNLFGVKRVAYVDIGRLLDSYKFRKSLEAGTEAGLSRIKTVVDSLQMIRRAGAGTAQLDTQLARAKYAFRQYYTQSNDELTRKVWERLNPLMAAYGEERKLQILIGANGAGTVLYGSRESDVTDDLISYVNKKFENGN